MFVSFKNLPNMEDELPLITKLSKGKAIKPSSEIQNHKSKKAFKFNFVLVSQNTRSWKTSSVRILIPNVVNLELGCTKVADRKIERSRTKTSTKFSQKKN